MKKNIVLVFFIIVALMASTGIVMGQMSQGQMGQQAVSDDTIKAQIGKAIQANPRLSIGDVFVDSQNGNVTLAGKVANKEAEQQIIDIAAKTPGVKSVKSKLEVYQQK